MAEDHTHGERLGALMRAEIALCRELTELAAREQEALITQDPRALAEAVQGKERCIDRFEALEDALREIISGALGQDWMTGVDGQPAAVWDDLLAGLPGGQLDELNALRRELQSAYEELRLTNGTNALMVKTYLVQAEELAALVGDVVGEHLPYGAGGGVRLPRSGSSQFLDRRA